MLMFIYFWFVLVYGWMPFLIYGVAKRRRGEGGKWQLSVAAVWLAILFVLVGVLCLPLTVFGSSVAMTAWVPLLIWGVARWLRSKPKGKWMTAGGGVWGLLAVAFVIVVIAQTRSRIAQFSPVTFNPEVYPGEVAVVEFPYVGEGENTLTVFPEESPPYGWFVSAVGTNRMVIPAGAYDRATLSVDLNGATLRFTFDTSFSATPDEVFVFQGGFPLTASVDVRRGLDNRVTLGFNLLDAAGNEVAYRSRKNIGFEALAPDGTCFWRGDFEWG